MVGSAISKCFWNKILIFPKQKQTLNEVENLYFHHMQMNPHARPAPPAPSASDPSTTQVTVTHHAPTRNMPISFRPKWGIKGSGSNSAEPNAEVDVNPSVEIDPSLAFPPESTDSAVPSPQHTTSSSAPHPSAALSPTTDSDNPFLPTSSVLTRSSLSEIHPTTTNSPFTTPSKVSPATDRRSRRAGVNIPHDPDSTGSTFNLILDDKISDSLSRPHIAGVNGEHRRHNSRSRSLHADIATQKGDAPKTPTLASGPTSRITVTRAYGSVAVNATTSETARTREITCLDAANRLQTSGADL
jgi:hypothetical protein